MNEEVVAPIFMSATILVGFLLAGGIIMYSNTGLLPRGLRWLPKAWGGIKRALLRVFYPEEVKPPSAHEEVPRVD